MTRNLARAIALVALVATGVVLAQAKPNGKEQIQANLAHPEEKDRTQAAWDGDKVVITVKMSNGIVHKRVLTMQPDGLMALEVTAEVGGKTETLKAVHQKK